MFRATQLKRFFGTVLITIMVATSVPAWATNEAMMNLLKILRDKGNISAEEYELLVNTAKADGNETESNINEVKKEVDKVVENNVVITTKGKLKISSEEGDWSFQPIGRVMWDYISTDEDGSGVADFEGHELRRARLGFKGTIHDWSYKFESDFANDAVSINDAYIGYNTQLANNKASIKLGQSHIPYGLHTRVSSNYMSFIDRPWFAATAISPSRHSGAVFSLVDPEYKWTFAASYTYESFNGGETEENNGKTFSTRASYVPYMQDKEHMLQVGAGYMNVSDDSQSFRFRQRLVSHVDRTRHLDVTVDDFDGANAYTTDILGVYGAVHTMAEYNHFNINSATGSDAGVDSYTVEVGYFLTGESLKWNKGYIGGITPKFKFGAWQVAARYESTTIDDPTIGDDKGDKYTLGLNYYPTRNIRFMLNYDQVINLKVDGVDAGFEPSSVKFRAQAQW